MTALYAGMQVVPVPPAGALSRGFHGRDIERTFAWLGGYRRLSKD